MDKMFAFLKEDSTISEAIDQINRISDQGGEPGMAIVMNESDQVTSVITDGDIRKAICRKMDLNLSIMNLMSKDFVYVYDDCSKHEQIQSVRKKTRDVINPNDPRWSKVVVVNRNHNFRGVINLFELFRYGDISFKKTAVYGMGYVGLTLALSLAELGELEVVGIDLNETIVQDLNKGIPSFFERGLNSLLEYCLKRELIAFKTNAEEFDADVHIICVGTPIDKAGRVQYQYLETAAYDIGRKLKSGDLVVCRSTVPVGTTRNFLVPMLEKHSGLSGGKDFHVAFAPERTVEGNALKEIKTLPQIIGGMSSECRTLATKLFQSINSTIIKVETLEAAEIVKLINNTFRDTVFSFANEVVLLCDAYNINAFDTIAAANEGYPRNPIPMPSPGVGGICLVKDPFLYQTSKVASNLSTLPFGAVSRSINEYMPRHVAHKFEKFLKQSKLDRQRESITVFVIGLAFKGLPETSDLRESPAVALIENLKAMGCTILGYDAVVSAEAIRSLGLQPCTLMDGIKSSNAIFVMNNHPDNAKFDVFGCLNESKKPLFFFDGWNMFSRYEIESIEGTVYSTLGYQTHTEAHGIMEGKGKS